VAADEVSGAGAAGALAAGSVVACGVDCAKPSPVTTAEIDRAIAIAAPNAPDRRRKIECHQTI
jgi:hypothetical protein